MFCHLHVHNEYSALDGYGTARQYAERASELGFQYIALTNHGNIAGCLKWQRECLNFGLVPILGAELYITTDVKAKGTNKPSHITVLAKNRAGWEQICKWITFGNLFGFGSGKPRIDFHELLNADLSGVIIMTACLGSWLKLPGAEEVLAQLNEQIPDDLFLEIMPHQKDIQKKYHKEYILPFHDKYGIPLVATNDCHYVLRKDWKTQECLLAIQRGAKWKDPNRWKFEIKGLHLRTEDEMRVAFQSQKQFSDEQIRTALDNTIVIAERCAGFRIEKQDIHLPAPPKTNDQNEDNLLYDICAKAIAENQFPNSYLQRLNSEFELIKKKKFSRYFLIVLDIIRHCKKHNIPVGPGRGSVGGCLIAYLSGITQIDPMRFELSFSRFLSEDRNDYPDIDIDFADNQREAVVKYIQKTYGKNNVCGISTDARMKTKAVIWDVSRVFEIPTKEVKELSNAVINSEDHKPSLELTIQQTESGQRFKAKYPEAAALALRLENQLRHWGQHPAAVIICHDDLTTGKYGSLRTQNGHVVSSWDMEDSEFNGLMKLDILGLATLSVLHECLMLVNSKPTGFFCHPESSCFFVNKEPDYQTFADCSEQEVGLEKIPLDDQSVFKRLSEGQTSGVFQFSARPSTELCKEMGINNFEDMIAAVALVRPGPYQSGMTENYVNRKKGRKWKPIEATYEQITKDTYGLIVYQEQVMQVISKVAGLPESTADKIRKVIGKKRDAKEFEPYRVQFVEGCKKQKTLSEAEANQFWEGLKEHANYSFNKSHATAYAMIGYWTAWLKTHYMPEFFCASLTYSKSEKQELINEAASAGIKISLPKTGISDAEKWVMSDDKKTLYAPFIEVNSIGPEQAKKICNPSGSNVGFFSVKPVIDRNSEIGKALTEIKANEIDAVPNEEVISKYFQFALPINAASSKIADVIKAVDLKLESRHPKTIQRIKSPFFNKQILECNACELRTQCAAPVLPSVGLYNAFIMGEAPGRQEDEFKRGFYEGAPSGTMLWEELGIHDLKRKMFFVTNACRCWPSQTKTPSPAQINACKPWFELEAKKLKPRIVLAIGNTALAALTGRTSGIMNLNGTTEWNEKYGCWICWCIHPSAVTRKMFNEGIANFAEKFKLLT